MIWFAKDNGATGYIGVDFAREVIGYASACSAFDHEEGVSFACDDMLSFLRRVPDNSDIAFVVNGVDGVIIDQRFPENREYVDCVAAELTRAVGQDGVIMGINSPDIFEGVVRDGKFEFDEVTNDRGGFRVIRRVRE